MPEEQDQFIIPGIAQADLYAGSHMSKAMHIVRSYVIGQLDKTDPIPRFNVYVVTSTYILGNWKAMVSTSLPDGMYYEVTHDYNEKRTYLDAYKKFANHMIPD